MNVTCGRWWLAGTSTIGLYGGVRPALPFEWEEVGVVSVDRFRNRKPECEVLVGRRR